MGFEQPDTTEEVRRQLIVEINSEAAVREKLEEKYGKGNVWSGDEMRAQFEVLQFAAPVVVVIRRSNNQAGSLMFQHSPRFYFGWQPDGGQD